jgi:hypothetical protein
MRIQNEIKISIANSQNVKLKGQRQKVKGERRK